MRQINLVLDLKLYFITWMKVLKNDPNYVSGVAKFLKSHRSLQERTISTSTLHTFGIEVQWSYSVFCNYNLNVLQLVYREGTNEYWYHFRQLLPPNVQREYQEVENPSLKVAHLTYVSTVGKSNKELSMKKFKPRKSHNFGINILRNTPNAQIH